MLITAAVYTVRYLIVYTEHYNEKSVVVEEFIGATFEVIN
jgi:hypothetical protein